jgi:broad specificity phosphatase PhoE
MMNIGYWAMMRHAKARNNDAEERYKNGDASAYADVNIIPSALHTLTPEGIEEAHQAGEWLKEHEIKFDNFFVSSFVRALQTAELLDIVGAKWTVDDRFGEKEGGIFHEMTPTDAEAYRRTIRNRAHEIDPFRFRPDRGESFNDVETRARSAIDSLPDSSLVVTHGHLMRVVDHIIMCGESSLDMKSWRDPEWQVPNCALIEYRRTETGLQRRVSLPCNAEIGAWEEIVRPLFTNAQLGRLVENALGRLK